MGQAALKHSLSVADYLELERSTDTKYEYHEGEVFAMAGGTVYHSLIGSNIIGEIGILLKGSLYSCFSSNLKIAVSPTKYLYPDAAVICGKPETFEENPHAANNPTIIVEVVSSDSESYDRGDKFWLYRGLTSLLDYVVVSQDKPVVDVFSRTDFDLWKISSYRGLDKLVTLPSLDITIPMTEIYAGITFENLEDFLS